MNPWSMADDILSKGTYDPQNFNSTVCSIIYRSRRNDENSYYRIIKFREDNGI